MRRPDLPQLWSHLLGRTLRARIVRTTAVVSVAVAVVMVGAVLLVLDLVEARSVRSSLHDQLAVVGSAVLANDSVDDEVTLPDDALQDTTWIYDPDGTLVSGPNAGRRIQQVATDLSRVSETTSLTRGDRAFMAQPVKDDKGTVVAVLVVTQSVDVYEKIRHAVVAGLLVIGLLASAGATLIAAWTVRRTFRPVQAMADRAEDWSVHDLEARFDLGRNSDEISALGATLNVLLDRVAGAIRGEQQLTAELAHELRTPLTAIRGEAELMLLDTRPEVRDERLARVVDLVDRMSATIQTLLDVARGRANGGRSAHVDDLVAAVLAERPLSERVPLVAERLPDLQVGAPLDLARRALAPVVDNAVRYAQSRVTITVDGGEDVRIRVADDGPGFADGAADTAFVAGAHDPAGAGAGLGLSLARRVARTLGGDVVLTSEASPTEVTLVLPRP